MLTDGYDDDALKLIGDHKANGVYNGGKYSAFEGGTRVPLILYYPKQVKAGVSDSLTSQIDIYATISQLLNIELGNDEAIDSQKKLNGFFNANEEAREVLIEETPFTLAIRENNWKYIRPANRVPKFIKTKKNINSGTSPGVQLYNLNIDPSEQSNIAQKHPDIVARLEQKMVNIENQSNRVNDL